MSGSVSVSLSFSSPSRICCSVLLIYIKNGRSCNVTGRKLDSEKHFLVSFEFDGGVVCSSVLQTHFRRKWLDDGGSSLRQCGRFENRMHRRDSIMPLADRCRRHSSVSVISARCAFFSISHQFPMSDENNAHHCLTLRHKCKCKCKCNCKCKCKSVKV